jgi:DNA-binding LacI/PurR family transcriptional regulator
MPTVRDIARDAEVSIATVSRVLNNSAGVSADVRERVLQVINRLGYVAPVGRRHTHLIGFAFTGPATFFSPYDAAIQDGMADASQETDYDLVLLNLQRDKRSSESYTQLFLRKGVRGVILRTTTATRETCRRIAGEGFPSLVVGDRFDDPSINFIKGDSRDTTFQAAEHLIGIGHSRIAVAASDVEDSDHTDRLEGYRKALAHHGLQPNPRWTQRVPAQRLDGSQVMSRFMTDPQPPTAIVITDPLLSVGAVVQAHRMGVRIPEDVSLVGFDDSDLRGNVYPTMTAVCQDARQLGYEAFLAVAGMVSGTGPRTVHRHLRTWFEIHGTTGPPPVAPVRVLPNGERVAEQALPTR